MVALAAPDGSLYNPQKAPKSLSSAREYESIRARYWDEWYKAERNAIWYTKLSVASTGRYSIYEKGMINALKDTGLECPVTPLSDPFTGFSAFDISTEGILFLARDPSENSSETLDERVYHVSLHSFIEPPLGPRQILVPGFRGGASSPTFSPDGKSAAFLKRKNATHYDKPRIFVVDDLDNLADLREIHTCSEKHKEEWSLRADSVSWSNNGKSLYVMAEDHGRGILFSIPTANTLRGSIPSPITDGGVVSSVYSLTTDPMDTTILITKTSLIDSSMFIVIDTSDLSSRLISSVSQNGSLFGLHASQVSEITFEGAGNYDVQAWVMKPSDFREDRTYPLAFLIHGGPASSWSEAWSTRWNPAVFAEQGYVVVLPNPTGSTGFGQDYMDAILKEWGGRPYVDLVRCFEYIKRDMKFVDTDRAVALGGSYGGYMINWIAGQALAKEFKTLVCHDGIFSLYGLYGSDVVTGMDVDFGGPLSDHKSDWDRWDPAQNTQNWATPMLIIHSDNDFRCNLSQGL